MNKSELRKALQHEEDGADLISNLPDLILLLILSCLRSTEEVIRTSILSRRWRYLWTSIPSLSFVFRYYRSDDSQESKFKELVDRLLLNRSVSFDRFLLSCGDHYSMSTVERWIQATVMRNVKQLDLRFASKEKSEDTVMPHCLVTCPSLEVLKLSFSNRGLRFPNNVTGFPALRVLELGYMELFDSETVEYFLENCPLLEELTLEELILEEIDLLCISSPKLKKLRFDSRFKGCLLISCPNLMCLTVTGYVAIDIICDRLYSLKEAEINLKPKHICRLFPGISHLETLNSDLYFLHESLDDAAAAYGPALPNLKTLELFSRGFYFKRKFLTRILKHCPALESLCLNIDNETVYDEWGFKWDEYEKLDEAESRKLLTPDVKWIRSFAIKGEKMKLDISRWKNKWWKIDATWGKKPKHSDWMSRSYLND